MGIARDARLGRILRERNKTREIGALILIRERAGTTNDLALSLAREGAPHGSLVLSEEQTAGRGRWHRQWFSPRGGLYLSAILRPRPETEPRVSLLPMAASGAAAEAVAESSGVPARIRWPNDLVLGDKKLGGVLCEASFLGENLQFAVVGLGLNVNQETEDFLGELRETATSLCLHAGRTCELLDLAACVVERLEIGWEECCSEPEAVLARWRRLAVGDDGAEVEVRERQGRAYRATTAGLTDDGGLRVRTVAGEVQILRAEEVSQVRFL